MNFWVASIVLSLVFSYFIQRHLVKHHREALRYEGIEQHHMFFVLFVPYVNLLASIIFWTVAISYSWERYQAERKGFFLFLDMFYGRKEDKVKKGVKHD